MPNAVLNSADHRRASVIDSRRAMKERLEKRDAEYAAAYPNDATGSIRGRHVTGAFAVAHVSHS